MTLKELQDQLDRLGIGRLRVQYEDDWTISVWTWRCPTGNGIPEVVIAKTLEEAVKTVLEKWEI